MSLFNSFDKGRNLAELGEPLFTGSGVKTAATRKAEARVNLGLSATVVNGVESTASGKKVIAGETALDGSNPTPVVTGLTTVTGFTATLKGSAAPGVGTSVLTYTASGGTVSVYAWKPTSSADTTLIASTGTETFGWVAFGT